jgi:hypothetical protein
VPLLAECEDLTVFDGLAVTIKGNRVKFHVSDVFLPNADELRAAFPDAKELEGTVIELSDSGKNLDVFAVIQVVQTQNVVVPVEKLKPTAVAPLSSIDDSTHKGSAEEAKFKTE